MAHKAVPHALSPFVASIGDDHHTRDAWQQVVVNGPSSSRQALPRLLGRGVRPTTSPALAFLDCCTPSRSAQPHSRTASVHGLA